MAELFYAYSKDNEPHDRRQPLEESPKRVTKMARFFAKQAGGQEVGILGMSAD
jgi:hypothetical protein